MRSTDEETKRTIARKVVEPLSNLDRLSKKAAWFDKERFKDDVFRVFQGRPVGIKRMNITPQPSQRLRLPWRLGRPQGQHVRLWRALRASGVPCWRIVPS